MYQALFLFFLYYYKKYEHEECALCSVSAKSVRLAYIYSKNGMGSLNPINVLIIINYATTCTNTQNLR